MKKINTLIVIVTFLFLTACGGGKIEGTWKPDTSGMGEMEKKMAEGAKLIFESGGKGNMNVMGMAIPMEWKVEGDELVMTMEIFGEKSENRAKFNVSWNTLIINEKK